MENSALEEIKTKYMQKIAQVKSTDDMQEILEDIVEDWSNGSIIEWQ